MTGFLIALLSGALMSVQGVFNTQVTKTTGLWVSNGWVQASALAACVAVWFFAGRDSIGTLWKVEPKYVLLGGVIGAGITWTVVKSMEQLGPADRGLSYRAFRPVWRGAGTPGMAQGDRYGNRPDWSCNFPVEIVQ